MYVNETGSAFVTERHNISSEEELLHNIAWGSVVAVLGSTAGYIYPLSSLLFTLYYSLDSLTRTRSRDSQSLNSIGTSIPQGDIVSFILSIWVHVMDHS